MTRGDSVSRRVHLSSVSHPDLGDALGGVIDAVWNCAHFALWHALNGSLP